jgi:drug/metabolite transporter (DMT)-like permease
MQVLATITGAVVFSMNFHGPKPWVQLGWFYFSAGAYLSGVLIQLCSIAVWAGYCSVRKRIFPADDAVTPPRAELAEKEVRIVFCVSLLVVCFVVFLQQHGVFANLDGAEELTLR